jgi:hypothetical protein
MRSTPPSACRPTDTHTRAAGDQAGGLKQEANMRRNTQADIAFIQNDLANEVIIQEDGSVVWPDGAMERLNAKLNPPGPTIFDHIKEACAKLAREDESSARACGWVAVKCGNIEYVEQPEHGWIAPNWRAACDPTFDGSERKKAWLKEFRAKIEAANA